MWVWPWNVGVALKCGSIVYSFDVRQIKIQSTRCWKVFTEDQSLHTKIRWYKFHVKWHTGKTWLSNAPHTLTLTVPPPTVGFPVQWSTHWGMDWLPSLLCVENPKNFVCVVFLQSLIFSFFFINFSRVRSRRRGSSCYRTTWWWWSTRWRSTRTSRCSERGGSSSSSRSSSSARKWTNGGTRSPARDIFIRTALKWVEWCLQWIWDLLGVGWIRAWFLNWVQPWNQVLLWILVWSSVLVFLKCGCGLGMWVWPWNVGVALECGCGLEMWVWPWNAGVAFKCWWSFEWWIV